MPTQQLIPGLTVNTPTPTPSPAPSPTPGLTTQPRPVATTPAQPQQAGGLDRDVVNLAKAIRQQESGGNFKARSKDGSFGAYQFIKPTWDATAKKFGVNADWESATPEQQNEVAYKQLKEWKDKGYNVGQIASMWNAGAGNPDAYIEGKRGVNQAGVAYNVADYARKVATLYQQYKAEAAGVSKGESNQQPPAVPQSAPKTFLEKLGNTLGDIFGGKQIGEGIGTLIARSKAKNGDLGVQEVDYSQLSPEAIARLQAKGVPTNVQDQRAETAGTIKGPTASQLVGDVGRIALNFVPGGSLEKGAAAGLGKLGLGEAAAKVGGKILGGAGIGYGADVTTNLANGNKNPFTPGLGTILGAAIPVGGTALQGLKKLGREVVGTSTGAGAGVIKEFEQSIAAGGERAKAAREALRGKIAPSEIVDDAKGALQQIIDERKTTYQDNLAKLKDVKSQLNIKPILDNLKSNLDRFDVKVTPQGLDFSQSALRFNKAGQDDITNIYEAMKNFGLQQGDRTVLGVDKLKQSFGDLYSQSGKARAFVASMRDSVSKVARQVPGYAEMQSAYGKSTGEIKEILKQLSLGDKASTDTAFRKLSSILRTNNEARQQVVQRLNELTDGELLSKVSGQQLSEVLPRGIIRQIGGVGAAGSLLTGTGIMSLLPYALISSPRFIGELMLALKLPPALRPLVEKGLFKQMIQQGVITAPSVDSQQPSGSIPSASSQVQFPSPGSSSPQQ